MTSEYLSTYFSAYFSTMWELIAPVLGNHLWQSTVFAAAAGGLTLVLRKHHARIRYGLWLAASVKFLIPFSLLTGLGSRLPWSHESAVVANPGLYVALEAVSQPFRQSAVQGGSEAAHAMASTTLSQFFPLLLAVWLLGFLVVVSMWSVRWRRISSAIRSAAPLCEGREVDALRRFECAGGVRHPIRVLLSPTSFEPGIFGIAQPVLIWPEGISSRLEDAHLDAILAHEVWHVRRRDNLFAALHMLVEAVFWFHPLVWWLGARLVEERERACDEEVLELGSDRQVYAESILKVCEFCLGSPLVCVSGVTGADLKQRMVHIMSARMLHKLDFSRKLLLGTAALLALALPIMFGVLNATPSHAQSQDASVAQPTRTYETISIRPNPSTEDGVRRSQVMFSLDDGSFTAKSVTLQFLVKLAYQIQGSQLVGPSDLMNNQKYDVDAKMSSADVEELRKMPMQERGDQGMLQALLRDRFKLAVHSEIKTLPVYDLVVDKNGPKLQESNGPRMMHMEKGELTSGGTHLAFLADDLSIRLGRTVVDKTGLKGNYAYTLRWTPDASEEERLSRNGMASPQAASSAELSGPPLVGAVQEQLGLKLEPRTEAVQVLVVDHVEAPAEN